MPALSRMVRLVLNRQIPQRTIANAIVIDVLLMSRLGAHLASGPLAVLQRAGAVALCPIAQPLRLFEGDEALVAPFPPGRPRHPSSVITLPPLVGWRFVALPAP